MPYTLTQEQIDSITDLEIAWGTTRLLPAWEDIPGGFRGYTHDIYVQIVDAMFCGEKMPAGSLTVNEGFDGSPEGLDKFHRCVKAHLRSFEPKHEHKIAGLALMIQTVMTITPDEPAKLQAKE